MLAQIDEICLQEGVYPHAFLAAHAHNYQRYTRIMKFGNAEIDVPFIVCGDGGHTSTRSCDRAKGTRPRSPMPEAVSTILN